MFALDLDAILGVDPATEADPAPDAELAGEAESAPEPEAESGSDSAPEPEPKADPQSDAARSFVAELQQVEAMVSTAADELIEITLENRETMANALRTRVRSLIRRD